MAKVKKVLNLINEVVGPMEVLDYINGGACLQYGVGGSGTLIMEASADELADAEAGTAQWTQIQMKNPLDIAGAVINELTVAGLGIADIVGYRIVRGRKSNAGAGPVTATLIVGVG